MFLSIVFFVFDKFFMFFIFPHFLRVFLFIFSFFGLRFFSLFLCFWFFFKKKEKATRVTVGRDTDQSFPQQGQTLDKRVGFLPPPHFKG